MQRIDSMQWRFAAVAFVMIGLAGCQQLRHGDRDTPDLVGRVLQAGQPVANVSIIVARAFDGAAPTCDDGRVSARTDEYGRFIAPASRQWRASDERPETRDQFLLCARRDGAERYDTLFRSMATRWDSLHVECDLGRTWLLPDTYGSSGQCLVTHYALDGQPLTMKTPRFPPLTCDTTSTEISHDGVGPLRSFGDIAQLRRLCQNIRDTTFGELFVELPLEEPRLVIDVAGEPVIFRNSSGVITDIVVSSPKFHTADGVRIGMPMSRLGSRKDLRAVLSREADGPYLLAWEDRPCGMAFGSGRPGFDVMDGSGSGRVLSMAHLREQPARLRIRRMYVASCMRYNLPGRYWEEQ